MLTDLQEGGKKLEENGGVDMGDAGVRSYLSVRHACVDWGCMSIEGGE